MRSVNKKKHTDFVKKADNFYNLLICKTENELRFIGAEKSNWLPIYHMRERMGVE